MQFFSFYIRSISISSSLLCNNILGNNFVSFFRVLLYVIILCCNFVYTIFLCLTLLLSLSLSLSLSISFSIFSPTYWVSMGVFVLVLLLFSWEIMYIGSALGLWLGFSAVNLFDMGNFYHLKGKMKEFFPFFGS